MADTALNPTNYGTPSSQAHTTDKAFIYSGADSEIRTVFLYDLLPSVTTAQMNAIGSPAGGMLVYNSDEDEPYFYSDSAADWLSLVDGLPES